MITTSTFFSGLFFELPVVVFILSKLGLVSSKMLKKFRKHALVGILLLSAIITPPDVISQVLVSIPILILYEIGIGVAKLVEKKKEKLN
jgi:sec-independent protein translocase protein TatC